MPFPTCAPHVPASSRPRTCPTSSPVGRVMAEPGPLTRKVLDYVQAMERLVPVVKAPADWAPLAEFVAVDEFERVGTFLEVQNWEDYTELLTRWASATEK